jgi:hypothetical protein
MTCLVHHLRINLLTGFNSNGYGHRRTAIAAHSSVVIIICLDQMCAVAKTVTARL